MVKTNRRKNTKRKGKRGYNKRTYNKKKHTKKKQSTKKGGTFFMAHLPMVILGLLDLGFISYLMYDIKTPSTPSQPGTYTPTPGQQQQVVTPGQPQPQQQQQMQQLPKGMSKEQCEKKKKELTIKIKELEFKINQKKSEIKLLPQKESAEELSRKRLEMEKIKREERLLKEEREYKLKEIEAQTKAALAAQAAVKIDKKTGGADYNYKQDPENDSPMKLKLKYELNNLEDELKGVEQQLEDLQELCNKSTKKGFFSRKDKSGESLDKELLIVKGALYAALKSGYIKTDDEINVKTDIIDVMFKGSDKRDKILEMFNSEIGNVIFRGNIVLVREGVYKIRDPDRLFASLGVIKGIQGALASVFKLFPGLRGKSKPDSGSKSKKFNFNFGLSGIPLPDVGEMFNFEFNGENFNLTLTPGLHGILSKLKTGDLTASEIDDLELEIENVKGESSDSEQNSFLEPLLSRITSAREEKASGTASTDDSNSGNDPMVNEIDKFLENQ